MVLNLLAVCIYGTASPDTKLHPIWMKPTWKMLLRKTPDSLQL